ncbi:MAG TPA: GTP-binding protein [Burkholderiales bacterium]|jgi:G3E family GTPase|nr:GTP-binding protein [Burkholderiales bacterium]
MADSTVTGRDPLRSRIPLTVITGFLGSGKTTLLNALLARPEAANTAVIINEYGEVGVDHDLVQGITESVTLLDNGCVCCVLRGDLEQALRDLFLARRSGEISSFERVILETTGLADPAPIMQTLSIDPALAEHYRLDGVITLADGVQGSAQLAGTAEAIKQAAVADRIVITKSDLADSSVIDDLVRELKQINPTAHLAVAVAGAVEPDFVLAVGLDRARVQPDAVERWLGPAHAPENDHHQHTHGILTFTLWFEHPFKRAAFERCIELLTSLRGADLLRVKGLVNVADESGPVVIQGVQHLFHPPVTLAAWPSEDRRSRLVFITRGITRETVANLFAAVTALN